MKNKLLLAVAFLGLNASAFAQVSDSEESKNQLGIIASPSLHKLFENNRSLPVGLIYKRQVKENQAWRLSTVGSYEKWNDPEKQAGYIQTKHDFTDFNLNLMFGYEWQQKLSKSFIFYYGADAGIIIDKAIINSVSYYSFPNDQGEAIEKYETLQSKDVELTYQLKPMIGFQFKIHPKLYFATESGIMLTHSRIKYESSGTVTYISEEFPDQNVEQTYKRQYYRAWYKPLSNIQLVYKF